MPIFFLVNNYTASSAEILSGSLQLYAQKSKPKDNLNVFIVGTETFGKGSVQEVIPLSGECALKMTSSLYYLPFDTCVQGKGITPDFVIENYTPPSETTRWMRDQFGRESVLKKHIKPHGATDDKKAKKSKKEEELPWKEKRKDLLAQDFVLQNTVTLIDLLNVGKKANPKMTSHSDQLAFLKSTYMVGQKLTLKELKD
jgi:carboxyl-terminal processing protease